MNTLGDGPAEARALTFTHLASFGSRNIGNGALIRGVERVLSEDLGIPVVFRAEPWDLYSRGAARFDERFVERVNRECDVLLVAAQVSFDGRSRYGHAGFRFDLPLELYPQLERPVIFYGLSHRTWPRQKYHHMDALRRSVGRILESDRILFSVRNDGTKEWLESALGYASERILVAPDPAVYVPTEHSWHPELEEGKLNVILAPNVEDEQH